VVGDNENGARGYKAEELEGTRAKQCDMRARRLGCRGKRNIK
jgi:hypothetical protein